MRVVITGGGGFVGGWLTKVVRAASHEAVDIGVDVTDCASVRRAIKTLRPDAVAHLAAVSFAPDATADPAHAFRVAVGGTVNILEAIRSAAPNTSVLIAGSSEVYGRPSREELPLRETSRLSPVSPYALSKLAQESVAFSYAARYGLSVVVTRPFNHTGPGQRPEFVVPAICGRVAEVAAGRSDAIEVGNLEVRRDFSDVRDVVEAYLRLLERSATGVLAPGGHVVNVASARLVSIRWIVEEFCRLAGIEPRIRVKEEFVRANEPADLWGDYSVLNRLTDWTPATPLSQTLADMWDARAQELSVSPRRG